MSDPAAAIAFVTAHGAGAIEHPGGNLLDHVVRTGHLLASWGARPALVLAGICHACYGTDGFARALIDRSQRAALIAAIGAEAESIVYLYASCDRAPLYAQLGVAQSPRLRDRFEDRLVTPAPEALRDFVELTFANELDLARVSSSFVHEHGAEIGALFARCRPMVSAAAFAAYVEILGPDI